MRDDGLYNVYCRGRELALDPLGFGPWESVKDEGAESREWREVNRSKLKAERERLSCEDAKIGEGLELVDWSSFNPPLNR